MRLRLPTRLSWKLLTAILPPVVLAVTAIVWLQYHFARRELLASIDKEMRGLAAQTASEMDDQLDQRYRDLFTLSETPLIADYYRNVDFQLLDEAEAYRRELERYLRRFAERGGDYAAILFLDPKGRPICRVAAPGARPALSPDDFRAAAATPEGKWWVSSVQDAPGTGPVLYYGKPVRDEAGALKGVLVLAYDAGRLSRRLETIAVGRHGRAYVLTASGRLLGARVPEPHGSLLSASARLQRRPWKVVVEAPSDDFLGPLTSVKDAAIATAILSALLLVMILLWLVRSLTRPIAELAGAARRIGDGDLEARVASPGDGELGDLAGAFNEMAESLDENRKANARLQSQLVQAEKLSAVGQLISAVAHELNNPLAAISAYVQLALMESWPQRMRDDLSHVYSNVLRCRKVVENLLFFVRQSRQERRRVDLNRVVGSALELLEYRLVKTEDVRVVQELAAEGPQIVGDFQQLVQVLVNLINNACDAMQGAVRYPAGKRLALRTGAADGRAFIQIQDNGPGVPPELQDKLFQPFFTTKDPGRGTGLGLSICRSIAREHGGDVTFRTRPEEGTEFRVELPLASPEELREAAVPPAPAALPAVPGRRVLVADDEPDLSELLARLLREDGDVPVVAHNGAEALKLLETETFDLVVSDMEMEHAKGADIFVALSGRRGVAPPPVLFVTGDILNPKVLEFLSRSGADYLVKPFDVEELRQTVRRLLTRKGVRL